MVSPQIADLERELEEFEERRTQWEQELSQQSQSKGRNLQLESKQVTQICWPKFYKPYQPIDLENMSVYTALFDYVNLVETKSKHRLIAVSWES